MSIATAHMAERLREAISEMRKRRAETAAAVSLDHILVERAGWLRFEARVMGAPRIDVGNEHRARMSRDRRGNGIHEVVSSILIGSTNRINHSADPKGSAFSFAGGRIGARMQAMTSVQVSLPGSLFAALRRAPHEVPREIRIAASILWYQQSALSMGRAAECAGLSRIDFWAELARRRVDVLVIDEEDLAREASGCRSGE